MYVVLRKQCGREVVIMLSDFLALIPDLAPRARVVARS